MRAREQSVTKPNNAFDCPTKEQEWPIDGLAGFECVEKSVLIAIGGTNRDGSGGVPTEEGSVALASHLKFM